MPVVLHHCGDVRARAALAALAPLGMTGWVRLVEERGLLQRFPGDVDERLAGTPGDPSIVLPKLVDLRDGEVIVDEQHACKRPDWTYGDQPVRLGPKVVRGDTGSG